MTTPNPAAARRRRLLAEMQGRSFEEAYLDPSIRADLEAEADDPSPDALVDRAMLDFARELVAEKPTAGPGDGPEMFFSTDTVVIVPGFLASSLSDTAERGLGLIWVDPIVAVTSQLSALQLGPFDGEDVDLDPKVKIAATGALPIFYDLLRLALEVRRYTTELFPVDWRKDLEVGARHLAARLRALAAQPGAKPIHLVAHSQGALVARRAVQLLGPDEARRILRHLVLLGPANFGSFSAVFALGGNDGLIALARRLAVEPPQGFQKILASMSGLYQLLPWDKDRVPWLAENDLGRPSFWKSEIDPARLAHFHGWGRKIDTGFFNDRVVMILGDNHGAPTVGGVRYDGMLMLPDPDFGMAGDGTVPHSCSVLPGRHVYLAPGTEHSMLATNRGAIDAVLDALADRPLSLPTLSADPADHLKPRAARVSGPTAVESCPKDQELNGHFVSGYDRALAEPEAADSARLHHRQDQLRETHVGLEIWGPSSPAPDSRRSDLELILGTSNLLPFDFLRNGDRLGRAVVKIRRNDGAVGTGFLVGPGILMTNNHVLPDPASAAAAYAVANYETAPADDAAGRSAVAPFDPQSLFVTSAELDFSFCAVRGLDFLGTIPVDRNSLNIVKSEYVNIIQHPRGRHKEIALQDNQVVKTDNVVVQYSCDTEPGSSGSPVFNNQWKLVALHHASVVTNSPEGRAINGPDPHTRYLNEGIRLSAIATWLETSDATTPERRGQMAKIRALFGGLDPQIGFFGALGRKIHGESAAEVVVKSYHGGADDLDIAFWNLKGRDHFFHESLADLGRIVADMGIDLWCFSHANSESLRALCDHLETNYQLDYEFVFVNHAGSHPTLAVVYRADALSVKRLPWDTDVQDLPKAPLRVLVRATTRRGEAVTFHLVPIPREIRADDDEHMGFTRALIETIGHQIQSAGNADWVLLGDAHALLAPIDLYASAEIEHEVLAAAAERDGAIVFLAGLRSWVDQVFVTPNLNPAFGLPGGLVVARDRELPQGIKALGEPYPIGLRLSLNGRTPRTSRKLKDQAPRPEPEPKVDVPKIDVPKIDVPKVEVPKVEVPKVDDPKPTEPVKRPRKPRKTRVEAPKSVAAPIPAPVPDADLDLRIKNLLSRVLTQLLADGGSPSDAVLD